MPPLAFTLSNTACAPALVRVAGPLTFPVSALVVPIWIVSDVTPGAVAPPLLDDEVDPPPPHAAATSTAAAATNGSLNERFISLPPRANPSSLSRTVVIFHYQNVRTGARAMVRGAERVTPSGSGGLRPAPVPVLWWSGSDGGM